MLGRSLSGAWREYDAAAKWCARRKLAGKIGDPLPTLLSADCQTLIDDDPEAFQDRVRLTAYALAMSRHEAIEDALA